MLNSKLKIIEEKEDSSPECSIGVRYFQFCLMFISLLVSFAIRISLSVAIIPMTSNSTNSSEVPSYPEWENIDVLLSSFFWGYIVPQIVAGQLGEYFGPKWFLFGTMLIGSIFHIATPAMAASLGVVGVMICRVIQGICQGFLYPSIQTLIGRWAPLQERARIANFVYSGASLGIAISMVITGAISSTKLGWPLAFYSMGGFGVFWAVIFVIFIKNSPSEHKTISEREKKYIEEKNAINQKTTKKLPTPWKHMLVSLPLWAALVAACGQCFGGCLMTGEIPSYLSNIMKFDINSNSQLSALPYLANVLMGLIASPLADILVNKRIITITNSRKIFNGLATFVPGLSVLWLAFMDRSQKELAVFLLVVAVGSTSFILSGYMVNVIDLAPNHTGTILGIVNGFGNIFSILGPNTVGWLGSDKTDPTLWKNVFFLTAGIYAGCGAFYVTFASANLQPWNDLEETESQKM